MELGASVALEKLGRPSRPGGEEGQEDIPADPDPGLVNLHSKTIPDEVAHKAITV